MTYGKCDVTVLSKPEQEWLIRYVHYDFRYHGIIFALYTVMRIWELCTLQCSDIDFDKCS